MSHHSKYTINWSNNRPSYIEGIDGNPPLSEALVGKKLFNYFGYCKGLTPLTVKRFWALFICTHGYRSVPTITKHGQNRSQTQSTGLNLLTHERCQNDRLVGNAQGD